MRKIPLHLICGLISAACIVLLLQTWIERSHAVRINRLIAEPGRQHSDDEPAEATLARAVALARDGNSKEAERAYQRVLQHGSPALQRLASYNLANLQLRQAMTVSRSDPQFLPKVELAKQHYRDLLAVQPDHWDARYNLERALWLVPETELLHASQDTATPRELAATTMKIEPEELP